MQRDAPHGVNESLRLEEVGYKVVIAALYVVTIWTRARKATQLTMRGSSRWSARCQAFCTNTIREPDGSIVLVIDVQY